MTTALWSSDAWYCWRKNKVGWARREWRDVYGLVWSPIPETSRSDTRSHRMVHHNEENRWQLRATCCPRKLDISNRSIRRHHVNWRLQSYFRDLSQRFMVTRMIFIKIVLKFRAARVPNERLWYIFYSITSFKLFFGVAVVEEVAVIFVFELFIFSILCKKEYISCCHTTNIT